MTTRCIDIQDSTGDGAADDGDFATAVIDQIELQLLVCDKSGRMLHANRAAWREIERGDFLKIRDGFIRCTPLHQSELALAIHSAATAGRRHLIQPAEDACLIIMPLGPDRDRRELALLMRGRQAACSALGLELFAARNRLTIAEQRVLRGLVESRSAQEIANVSRVAVSTVRTQIQSIRSKLGVGNIDGLLLAVARLPPVATAI